MRLSILVGKLFVHTRGRVLPRWMGVDGVISYDNPCTQTGRTGMLGFYTIPLSEKDLKQNHPGAFDFELPSPLDPVS
jgi:hypothetical protein